MNECLGNCVTCLETVHSLFKNLSESELEVLNHKRRKFNFYKGAILYQEGEEMKGLICLNEGKVKLVKKGKIEDEFIVSLHKTVDFVGFDDLMFNGKCSSTAIAIEDSSICIIDKVQFFKVIKSNSELALDIISNQSGKSIAYQNKLVNISQSNLTSRLAFAINQLTDFYGLEKDNKTLALQIKRREIAAISNMNTANVIRTLSKFKKEKIIDTDGQKIVILNTKRLEELAK